MITLTSAQEAIVKDDETVKNFVVHFPNGERADLSNADVVFESVKFTESVCSDQSFRFGGTDASCIEFQTVGVGNIIGLTIQCEMQFSLSGSTVTIPYGTFVVDSCPRDHSSMVRRKVTAYTPSVSNGYLSEFENKKLWNFRGSTPDYKYTPNFLYLIEETFGLQDGFTHSETVVQPGASQSLTWDESIGTDADGWDVRATITSSTTSVQADDALYQNLSDYNDSLRQEIMALCETAGVSGASLKQYYSLSCEGVRINELNDPYQIIYPYIYNIARLSAYVNVTIKIYKTDGLQTVNIGTTQTQNAWTYNGSPGIAFKRIALSTDLTVPMPVLTFENTLECKEIVSGTEQVYYSFGGALDMGAIATAWAEMSAGFFRRNRDDTISLIHLDNSAPYALTADDVEGSAWWDEYVVQPVGIVRYTFKNPDANDEEQNKDFDLGNGYSSVYDLSDNWIMKNMLIDVETVSSNADMTDHAKYYVLNGHWYFYSGRVGFVDGGEYTGVTGIIESMLRAHFTPYLGAINFTPLEATFRGMPFLQCGDAITLTAADGTVINSYILNQSFGGIQHISQDVETVQGTVIGSEVVY